ncbi:MAG: tetratricopeptide repeat protein [Armatimonadetes bacterium]|nr:tetratricopeptide repeat protein [Armatimonadota bacterium]
MAGFTTRMSNPSNTWGRTLQNLTGAVLLSILIAVHSRVSCQEVEDQAEEAIRSAERMLRGVPVFPPKEREYADYCLRAELEESQDGFKRVLAKYGPTARTFAGLGQCRLRLGDYEAAARSYGEAVKLSPADTQARVGYQKASRLLRIARAVRPWLSNRDKVLQLYELPNHRRGELLLVLSVKVANDSLNPFSDVRLTLFRKSPSAFRRLWRSRVLRDQRFEDANFADVQVTVFSTSYDRTPQIAVSEVHQGASWTPSHLDLFTLRGHRLTKTFELTSSFPVWIEDINRDGRYEIGNYYEIGRDMGHVKQPVWTDIYACRQGRYVLANRYFPSEFRHWSRDLPDLLQQYPRDTEIQSYLRYAEQIMRKPQNHKILSSYERSLRCPSR